MTSPDEEDLRHFSFSTKLPFSDTLDHDRMMSEFANLTIAEEDETVEMTPAIDKLICLAATGTPLVLWVNVSGVFALSTVSFD